MINVDFNKPYKLHDGIKKITSTGVKILRSGVWEDSQQKVVSFLTSPKTEINPTFQAYYKLKGAKQFTITPKITCFHDWLESRGKTLDMVEKWDIIQKSKNYK